MLCAIKPDEQCLRVSPGCLDLLVLQRNLLPPWDPGKDLVWGNWWSLEARCHGDAVLFEAHPNEGPSCQPASRAAPFRHLKVATFLLCSMGKGRNHIPKGPDAPHNPIWMSCCSPSSMSTTRCLQRRARALIPRQTTFGHLYLCLSIPCLRSVYPVHPIQVRSEKTLFQNGY